MDKTTSWMSLSKRVLGFATTFGPEDDEDPSSKRACIARDRLTHRVIEKKRRDRMNNCLADLSQLIPPGYLRQGQGRIEKTEVIEMAIKHIQHLQQLAEEKRRPPGRDRESYQRGFKACQEVVIEFLVDIEGCSFDDSFCARLVQKMQARACKLPEDLNSAEEELRSEQAAHQRFGSVTDAILYRRHSDEQQECGRDDDTQLYRDDLVRPESGYVSDYVNDPRLQPDGVTQATSDGNTGDMAPLALKRCSPPDAGHVNAGAYKFKNDIHHRFTADDAPPPPSSSPLSSLSSLSSQYWSREGASGNPTGTDEMVREETNTSVRCCDVYDRHDLPYSPGKLPNEPSSGMPPLIGVDQDGVHYPVPHPTDVQRSDNLPDISDRASSPLACNHTKTVADAAGNVPGFALHPSGSFYLPVVVPSQAVAVAMLDYSSMGLCHPVNIHVRFGVPRPHDGATVRHSHRTSDDAPTVTRSCDESREISRCPSDNRRMFTMQCDGAQRNTGQQPYIMTG